MKKALFLAAATLSLVAFGGHSAMAQDADKKPQVQPSPITGKPVVVVPSVAGAGDMYKAAWAFSNLDAREVRRYHKQGFSDSDIKGAANVALRTGLDLEYVFRLVREAGYPLKRVATMYNVSTLALSEEIPGYGAESMSIMTPTAMTN
jgi:hypothetical protein